ncbi:hypothetical protein BDB00DRAFT_533761 [Zychaea mexicana]|uniref:uncharacterized protein n=1 Tax=Zychaea mexicana TaxID=64656 RepID=UPI0022FDDEE7|nr:uncharacterized protein BDB00DRAFT_533761 [Zychaea mexicana]KAI9490744.1 hypothetical protein BDB00DRAFT_533761 [Zychaea mexicana]
MNTLSLIFCSFFLPCIYSCSSDQIFPCVDQIITYRSFYIRYTCPLYYLHSFGRPNFSPHQFQIFLTICDSLRRPKKSESVLLCVDQLLLCCLVVTFKEYKEREKKRSLNESV